MTNTESPVVYQAYGKKLQNLELDLVLGRASVIYADESFTLYYSVRNISSEPLYIWATGILASTDFDFKRTAGLEQALPPKESIIIKLGRYISQIAGTPERFIFYIMSFRLRIKKAYVDYKSKEHFEEPLPAPQGEFFTDAAYAENEIKQEEEVDRKLTADYLKVYYRNQIKQGGAEPWEISPGESTIQIFIGTPRKSLFFRPDKYKLTMYVDYSNRDREFFRETKVEEVDILTSLSSLIVGAVTGGLLGGILVRFLTAQTIYDILIWRNLFEIIGTGILSLLAVIALSRKTGAQTLVTIQDFWGGFFVGFLVGYSGKTFFEKIIGVS